ncbi:MAG TPA: DMT family transporter [Candidatus Nanoarchaeia archaeon]|nr:DMT family transporter [Candidatus Nanoarchaeia archaeon]
MESKKGLMLVLGTAVISGFSIFINSYGVKGFDSSVFTFSKNFAVALALIALILGMRQWREIARLSRRQWSQLFVIGVIGGSIPFLLFFKGLQLASGATASFIHKTLFLYAAVFAVIFLKEKLSKGLLIGCALLLAGNFVVLMPKLTFSFGHLLILIAALFWAAENVYAKHVLKQLSGTMVAFGRMFFGSILLLFFIIAMDKESLLIGMTSAQYGWIGITSILLLAYVVTYYNGLKLVKVSSATAILVLGSVITTLLDLLFKGTPVTLSQAFGMVLIAAGIVSVVWFSPASGKLASAKAA